MIITRLAGGMGNQMFQYAAGLAVSHRLHCEHKLDLSWFSEDGLYRTTQKPRYALNCFNITEQFASRSEVDEFRGFRVERLRRPLRATANALLKFTRNITNTRNRRHFPPSYCFYDGFLNVPTDTYLEGLFQSERFFQTISPQVKMHFTFRFPPTPEVAQVISSIEGNETSVALHFRRGDYATDVRYSKYLGALAMDYYYEAVAMIKNKVPNPTFYVFSDDIDFIEHELQLDFPTVFVKSSKSGLAHDDLRLMSQCDHIVCANSTFSWWAAWLNPNDSKMILTPTPWFAQREENEIDLVPESWLRIPRAGSKATG